MNYIREQSKTECMARHIDTGGLACSNSIWEAEIGGPAKRKGKKLPVKSRNKFYIAEVSKV